MSPPSLVNTEAITTTLPDRPIEIASSALKQAEFAATLATLDSDACAELVEKWSRPMIISGIGEQRACVRLFRHWTQIDPERAAASLMEMRVSSVGFKRQFVHLAAEGWGAAAAYDPDVLSKSLPLLSKSTNRGTQKLAVEALFGGIEASDFAETVRRARALRGELPASLTKTAKIEDDDAAINEILTQWFRPYGISAQLPFTAKGNPLDIYRYATAEISDPRLKWRAQQLAFVQLAQLNPALAASVMEEVGAPESPEQKSELISMMAVEWCNRDTAAAMEWILDHSPDERKRLLSEVTKVGGSSLEPRQMAEIVQLIPKSEWPAGAVISATQKWAQSDPVAALDWFAMQPEAADLSATDDVVTSIWFNGWETTLQGIRRVSTLKNFSASPDGPLADQLRMSIAWSARLPSQLAELTALRESLGNTEFASLVDVGILQAQAWQDPLKAREALLLNSRLEGEARRETLEKIAGAFHYNESLSDTLAWTKNLPEDDAAIVMGAALYGNLSRSPEQTIPAMEWLNTLTEAEMGNRSVERVADRTVQSIINATGDRRIAADWAATGAPEQLRESAVGRAVQLWAASDPFAAAEWLGGLPAGSVGDEPVVRLIDQIAWDPEQAFAWGATIVAPDLQAKKLGEIVDTWSVYAPEAVRNAIEASTLSPETKAALMQQTPGLDDK
ncbi:MAG: hypothetical protein R3F19_21345 [Verrucomicrobiales bacterium]